MSALANIFSTIDSVKRVLADRLGSPVADIQRTLGRAAEDSAQFRKTQQAGGPAATEAMLNTALNFSPAGMIVPGTKAIASSLGIDSVVDRALDMFKSGKSQWQVGTESEKALTAARNPGEALSVFIGPNNMPYIKLDTKNARVASTAPVKLSSDMYGSFLKLDPKVQGQLLGADGPGIPLVDYLLHPSLYQLSPAANTAVVRHSPLMDLTGSDAGYSTASNAIGLPSKLFSGARMRNDPYGVLLENLTHEGTHMVMAENSLRAGTSPTIQGLLKSVADARTQGSFRSPAQLDAVETAINNLAKVPSSEARDAALHRIYSNDFGEWMARQGSQYGRSLPMMNERGSTY